MRVDNTEQFIISFCSGYGGMQRWPARPGEEQYEWEELRTIKSGMGCTVDGIDTRVDQLRLLGNGVVPQTAAKAWIILNEKPHK